MENNSRKYQKSLRVEGSRGFTLIEAIVSIAIIGIIGFIISDILTKAFRGGDKTQLIGTIKQNGQSALNIMDNTIRNADAVLCTGQLPDNTIPNSTILTLKDGSYTRFSFYPQTAAENGFIMRDNPVISDVNIANTFCTNNANQIVGRWNRAVITDTNLSSGVSLRSGQFVRNTLPGHKDAVSIEFSLSPGINAGTQFENQIGTNNQVNFQTTIQLR